MQWLWARMVIQPPVWSWSLPHQGPPVSAGKLLRSAECAIRTIGSDTLTLLNQAAIDSIVTNRSENASQLIGVDFWTNNGRA
jgi:hypothetical protein